MPLLHGSLRYDLPVDDEWGRRTREEIRAAAANFQTTAVLAGRRVIEPKVSRRRRQHQRRQTQKAAQISETMVDDLVVPRGVQGLAQSGPHVEPQMGAKHFLLPDFASEIFVDFFTDKRAHRCLFENGHRNSPLSVDRVVVVIKFLDIRRCSLGYLPFGFSHRRPHLAAHGNQDAFTARNRIFAGPFGRLVLRFADLQDARKSGCGLFG